MSRPKARRSLDALRHAHRRCGRVAAGSHPQHPSPRGRDHRGGRARVRRARLSRRQHAGHADTLGIRQASLYYYFTSKEAALEQVCMQGVGGFYETAQAIEAGPGTPREKLASLIRAHIAPLLDRSNFVRVFLTQRQFLPNESRRRIGKWSRGIEEIFETVIRQGMRKSEFRADADPRLSTLAILGTANAVAAWYGKENASIERIGNEFVALALNGLASATKAAAGRRDRLP